MTLGVWEVRSRVDKWVNRVRRKHGSMCDVQSSRVADKAKGASNVRSSFFAVRMSMCYWGNIEEGEVKGCVELCDTLCCISRDKSDLP
jgi:hypothetical protein